MDQRIQTVENQVLDIYDIHKQKKRDYYKSLPKTYTPNDNIYKNSPINNQKGDYSNDRNQNYIQEIYSNENNDAYLQNNLNISHPNVTIKYINLDQ